MILATLSRAGDFYISPVGAGLCAGPLSGGHVGPPLHIYDIKDSRWEWVEFAKLRRL